MRRSPSIAAASPPSTTRTRTLGRPAWTAFAGASSMTAWRTRCAATCPLISTLTRSCADRHHRARRRTKRRVCRRSRPAAHARQPDQCRARCARPAAGCKGSCPMSHRAGAGNRAASGLSHSPMPRPSTVPRRIGRCVSHPSRRTSPLPPERRVARRISHAPPRIARRPPPKPSAVSPGWRNRPAQDRPLGRASTQAPPGSRPPPGVQGPCCSHGSTAAGCSGHPCRLGDAARRAATKNPATAGCASLMRPSTFRNTRSDTRAGSWA